MTITGMHHVSLSVADFNRSVAFYRNGLGLTEICQWDMGGTPAIMLALDDGTIIEIFGNGSSEKEQNVRFGHIALATDDVDAAYSHALSLGATSHMEPADATLPAKDPMSVRIAFVLGPDDEKVEFFKVLK